MKAKPLATAALDPSIQRRNPLGYLFGLLVVLFGAVPQASAIHDVVISRGGTSKSSWAFCKGDGGGTVSFDIKALNLNDNLVNASVKWQIGESGASNAVTSSSKSALNDPAPESPSESFSVNTSSAYKVTITATATSVDDSSFTASASIDIEVAEEATLDANKGKCCFNSGDSVSTSDFDTTVNPLACCDGDAALDVTPDQAPGLSGVGPQKQDTSFTLKATGCPATPTDSVTVPVADPDEKADLSVSLNLGAYEDIADDIENALAVLSGGAGAKPCSADFGGATPSISRKEFYRCCPSQEPCVQSQSSYSASENLNVYSVECSFPFAGVPYIASTNVDVGSGGDLSYGFSGTEACSSACVQFGMSPTVSASGGASVTVLGSAIAGSLNLVKSLGGISAQWNSLGCETPGFCLKGNLQYEGCGKRNNGLVLDHFC